MGILLGVGFTGIVASEVDGNPPNCTLACGLDSLLLGTVWRNQLRTKQGAILDNQQSRNFFRPPFPSDVYDPQVLYSPFGGGRFLASGVGETASGIYSIMAMLSAHGSPTKLTTGWVPIIFNIGNDSPQWGYNANGWTCVLGQPWGAMIRLPYGQNFRVDNLGLAIGNNSRFDVISAPDSLPGDPVWMIARAGGFQGSTPNYLQVSSFQLLDAGSPPTLKTTCLEIQPGYKPAKARQPIGGDFDAGPLYGNGILRTIGGVKLIFYAWANGAANGSNVVQWVALDVTADTPVIVQQGIFGVPRKRTCLTGRFPPTTAATWQSACCRADRRNQSRWSLARKGFADKAWQLVPLSVGASVKGLTGWSIWGLQCHRGRSGRSIILGDKRSAE